jgi:PKD repeat protein
MTSITEHIEELEIEVTFYGDVTKENYGHDSGEAWGAKFSSTMQSYYVVEDIQFEKVDDEYADRVQTWLFDNYDYIEEKIIKEYNK